MSAAVGGGQLIGMACPPETVPSPDSIDAILQRTTNVKNAKRV